VHRLLVIVSAAALAGVPLGAQSAPANLSPSRTALWREIRAVNDSMEAAFNRGDMKAVARFYADDARLAGQGGPVTEGRDAIDQYWAGIKNPKRWRLEVLAVGGSPALAYQQGRSHLTTASPEGAERTSTVDFVVIWRRQPNGSLRMLMDLY
jgi:uncharacterized protein (TIGR02246 family)